MKLLSSAVLADYRKGLVLDIPSPLITNLRMKSGKFNGKLNMDTPNAELVTMIPKEKHQKELGKRIQNLRSKSKQLSIQ